MDIALEPLQYLAGIKILLALSVISFGMLVWKQASLRSYLTLYTITILTFLVLLLAPLRTMWWGNNGDEMYMAASFTNTLAGNYFTDHYYHTLPPFYPPLYFWVTGFLSHGIATNGITASKIGLLLSTITLTFGTYLWLALYRRLFTTTFFSPLFSIITPIILLTLIDFDAFIFKPHEMLSALWMVLFVSALTPVLTLPRWNLKQYAFFALSGATIFMTYYFWWVLIAPTLIILALFSDNRRLALTRVVIIGILTLVLSMPFIYPFFKAALHLGIENLQGVYFSIDDILTFLPWKTLSIPSVFLLIGGMSLFILRRYDGLILLGMCYLYQVIGLVLFVTGHQPMIPSKPFLYGVTALLSTGLAFLITTLITRYSDFTARHHQALLILSGIFLFSLSPMVRFIDNPRVYKQFSEDFWQPIDYTIATTVQQKIPDYASRTWLTSTDNLSSYLPLSSFIAHNAHYNNHLAHFSDRLATVIDLTRATTPAEFYQKSQATNPPISGLVLYYDQKLDNIPLIFWLDHFPNGGYEFRYNLSPSLISPKYWHLVSSDNGRLIYIPNN